jgi:hypothetical protein
VYLDIEGYVLRCDKEEGQNLTSFLNVKPGGISTDGNTESVEEAGCINIMVEEDC